MSDAAASEAVKPTPGPWEARDAITGIATKEIYAVESCRYICSIRGENKNADAALIAAAPDLLAALLAVLGTGLNGGNNVRLAFIAAGQKELSDELLAKAEASEKAVIAARAAISKAEARS